MAKTQNYLIALLILFSGACRHIESTYKIDPDHRIDAVIVDTAVETRTVIVPEIPIDSASRLPDDPPVSYQPPQDEVIVEIAEKTLRQLVRESYMSQVGVREATGRNDGKQVEAYLRATGLGKGYAWCAAFLRWNYDAVGVKTTITAWSPTAHNPLGLVYFNHRQDKDILPADVFTLWYAAKKRIAHTGFVDSDGGNGIIETVEGNTNGGGSRDGDGVYKRKRLKRTLYSITRWIND